MYVALRSALSEASASAAGPCEQRLCPVHLLREPESILGQIEADRANLHLAETVIARECLTTFTLWHLDAGSGSHPPHLKWGR